VYMLNLLFEPAKDHGLFIDPPGNPETMLPLKNSRYWLSWTGADPAAPEARTFKPDDYPTKWHNEAADDAVKEVGGKKNPFIGVRVAASIDLSNYIFDLAVIVGRRNPDKGTAHASPFEFGNRKALCTFLFSAKDFYPVSGGSAAYLPLSAIKKVPASGSSFKYEFMIGLVLRDKSNPLNVLATFGHDPGMDVSSNAIITLRKVIPPSAP